MDGTESLSPEDLWDYCVAEYASSNRIVQRLLRGFFATLEGYIGHLSSRDRVLEVGCGAGVSSLRIQSMLNGQHFEVSEYDERYVSEMRRREFPIPFSGESVYEMHRADGEFDCVILLEVLEHLEEYHLALSELFRVSSKYVIISVPNEPLWRMLNLMRGKYLRELGNTPGHINHWTPNGLRRLLGQYGTVEELRRPAPWTVALVRRTDAPPICP